MLSLADHAKPEDCRLIDLLTYLDYLQSHVLQRILHGERSILDYLHLTQYIKLTVLVKTYCTGFFSCLRHEIKPEPL